jgi:REP-associated tyrosine transposase
MGRIERKDAPGALHHVFNRGLARRTVTETRQDIRNFLSCFARMAHAGLIEILAYSILPNHFHLLLRSTSGALSKAVGVAINRYVRMFNRQRRRDGSLFRGRFGSTLVDSERYFHTIVRYLDLNPVKAGLARHAGEYAYGSARHYMLAKGPIWLTRTPIESRVMAGRTEEAYLPSEYCRVFADAATEGELAIVERRMAMKREVADPLEDLVGASPRDVRIWMINRARVADGTAPGLPIVSADTIERVVRGRSNTATPLQVRPGTRLVPAEPILRAGMLRDYGRLNFKEISARTSFSRGRTVDLVERHRQLLLKDESYTNLASEILAEAVRCDFPELPRGGAESDQKGPAR